MFVKRVLLKRKIKRCPAWQHVQEYHDLPFKHQLRDVIRRCHSDVTQDSDDVTRLSDDVTRLSVRDAPETWTFASLMVIDGVLYLGQKRGDQEAVFKRELPFTLKVSYF